MNMNLNTLASIQKDFSKRVTMLRLRLNNMRTVLRIKKKLCCHEKICVLFLVVHGSVWQYEDVYTKFKSDARFDTKIIIVPYTLYGKQVMIDNMKKTEQVFLKQGHEVFVTYGEDTDQYLDIKAYFKPDIVFFTNPHKLTEAQFYINNFADNCLTCYAPYGFLTARIQQLQFNQEFHNLLWCYFLPTNMHKRMAQQYADNKGRNTVVVGYPKCDVFNNEQSVYINPWKNNGKNQKKLIWAPHHTIKMTISSLDSLRLRDIQCSCLKWHVNMKK